MGLFSFLRGRSGVHAERRVPSLPDPAELEQLRTRLRRRLIGVAVLVLAAVLVLPPILDRPPRPADATVSIEVTQRVDANPQGVVTAQVVTPSAPPGSTPRTFVPPDGRTVAGASSPVDAVAAATGRADPAAAAAAGERASRARDEAASSEKSRVEVDRADQLRAEHQRAEKIRAEKERLEREKAARDKADRDKAEREQASRLKAERERIERERAKARELASVRHWIQVGAYAEPATVRSVRQRIDKLGLRSVEQPVDTSAGPRTRVRLGPFASREEADRALARLKDGGLTGSVISP